jgi:hypothetical protein
VREEELACSRASVGESRPAAAAARAALLDRAEVEERVHDRGEPAALAVHDLEVAPAVGLLEGAREQEVREQSRLVSGVRSSCETIVISSDF